MAGTFEYDEATNTVTQTDGTSGTPATFTDMYAADLAGSLALAETQDCDTGMTLDIPIQAADSLALQITFELSGTSAGAGDTLDITGTDFSGDAQVESIDVSDGDDVYTGDKKWRTITNIDCTGWADGEFDVSQPRWGVVWEIVTDAQYKIDADIDFGDGATSSYFQSTNEMVYFEDGHRFRVVANATLQLGITIGDWGSQGSQISIDTLSDYDLLSGGTFLLYDSRLTQRTGLLNVRFATGEIVALNSTFSSDTGNVAYYFQSGLSYVELNRVYFNRVTAPVFFITPDIFENIHSHANQFGLYARGSIVVTVNRLLVSSATSQDLRAEGGSTVLSAVDLIVVPTSIEILSNGDIINSPYTVNIHVTDKDGADLAGVDIDATYANLVEGTDGKTYKCIQDHTAVDATHQPITGSDWESFWVFYDDDGGLGGDWDTGFDYKADAVEFSTATTDADGDIAEQVIQYKKWVDTSEVLEGRIHKFVFTHADYPDVTMSNVTVDKPLVWEIDMGQSSSDLLAINEAAIDNKINLTAGVADADMVAVSGDSTAADNLESTYDGTGYVNGVAPATQDQLGNIANTGAAINTVAASGDLQAGTEGATEWENTRILDGTYHAVTEAGGAIDSQYTFNVGSTGVPVSVTLSGRLFDPPATSDIIDIFAWDYVGSAWAQVGTLDGINSAVDSVKTIILFTNHVGTGVNAGDVQIRFEQTGLGTGTILYLDLLYCSFSVVSSAVGYANGTIWIDTVNGTAGTTPGVNGVADLPVDSLADALTLSGSTGLIRFEVAPQSSLTFATDMTGFLFNGNDYTIDMDGQNADSLFVQGATVEGILTSSGSVGMVQCRLSDGVTLPSGGYGDCVLPGNIELSGGFYIFNQCLSGVAGTGAPSFDLNGVGAQSINFRHYSGGIEVKNFATGDTMSLEGDGQLILNANCTDGTIAIRGNFTITDNVSGGFLGTISDDARFDVDQIAVSNATLANQETIIDGMRLQ